LWLQGREADYMPFRVRSHPAGFPIKPPITAEELGAEIDFPTHLADYAKYVAQPIANVKGFGAKGDGSTDDSQAFSQAASAAKTIFVPFGTYLINADLTIDVPVVFDNGARLNIPSGKTLTLKYPPIARLSQVCFEGSGTVKITQAIYSLGWFAGNSANEKWDFLRRGLAPNQWYIAYWPDPDPDDPAAYSYKAWKVDGPLYFDNPENLGQIICDGHLYVTDTIDSVLCFSPNNKTENIHFVKGIKIFDPDYLAGSLIHVKGGARIKFDGEVTLYHCNIGLLVDNSISPCDELQFDFLECTYFKDKAVKFDCQDVVMGAKINFFFSNGAAADTASNFMYLAGPIRGFVCDYFLENIYNSTTGLYDVADSVIKITVNDYGFPERTPVTFKDIYCVNSMVPIIKAIGTSDKKIQFKVESITTNFSTTEPAVILDYVHEGIIERIIPGRDNTIEVTDNCDVIVVNTRPIALTYPALATRMIVQGNRFRSGDIADDSVMSVHRGDLPGLATILILDTSNNTLAHATLLINILKDTCELIAKSDNVNLTTGDLTGTTGTDGYVNISVYSGHILIENRLGQTVKCYVTKYGA